MLLVKSIATLLVSYAALAPLTKVFAQSQSTSQASPLESPSTIAFKGLPETQEIAATLQTPIAVRGSVLILPIVRRNPQVAWPATIALRLGDGRRITGKTAQIESRGLQRSEWASPKQVTATTEAKGDDDVVPPIFPLSLYRSHSSGLRRGEVCRPERNIKRKRKENDDWARDRL